MRMMSLAAMSAALLITPALAAQGTTQAGTAAASAAEPAKPAKAEKKICKRLAASGTRLEERVCMTKSEWKKVEDEAR